MLLLLDMSSQKICPLEHIVHDNQALEATFRIADFQKKSTSALARDQRCVLWLDSIVITAEGNTMPSRV